jgi:tripartite-type tricarboxylate transporter receptor subunit TctC
VLNGAFYSLPYDVRNDFAPISPLVTLRGFLFARKAMPAQQTPEALGALVKGDAEKWWPIIKELGIRAE